MADNLTKKAKYKESFNNRDSLKFIPSQDKLKAQKSIKKLHKTETEKISSGAFKWVTITPDFGKPYKTLRKV